MKLLDIPFSQAWAFCWTQPSYVISAIVLTAVGIAIGIIGVKQYQRTQNAVWGIAGCGIAIILIAAALLTRPCNVAAATNPENAANGHYIG